MINLILIILLLLEIHTIAFSIANGSPLSAGLGAMAAIITLILFAGLSAFVTLIRNYKKRRKFDKEFGRQNDGRPQIKV